jgi:4-hydroxy-2-oxoheptanedioate aldolase
MRILAGIVAVAFVISSAAGALDAQGPGEVAAASSPRPRPAHLNPMVEKLSRGEVALGVSTDNFTVENARALARSGLDYVYLEMEHGVMSIDALQTFLIGMVDKAAAVKTGNPGPTIAVYARFPPYPHENSYWIPKQALDMGLMGVMFNNIETREQAMRAVQIMRYPQNKGSRYMEPVGLRGHGAGAALWFWGIEEPEYLQHADVWPLNPQGDLLALMMIETATGVKNIDEIASVPGASIYISSGSDLSMSYGVFPQRTAPEVEAGRQAVLRACRTHNVICGGTPGTDDIAQRLREGYKFINVGGAGSGLSPGAANTLRAAREAVKAR